MTSKGKLLVTLKYRNPSSFVVGESGELGKCQVTNTVTAPHTSPGEVFVVNTEYDCQGKIILLAYFYPNHSVQDSQDGPLSRRRVCRLI